MDPRLKKYVNERLALPEELFNMAADEKLKTSAFVNHTANFAVYRELKKLKDFIIELENR